MNDVQNKSISWQLLYLTPAWLVVAWVAAKASWFWERNPEMQFGWIVLLLSGYLIWEAWETRPAMKLGWNPGSVLLGVIGCLALFVTQLYQAAYGLTAASMSGLGFGMICIVTSNLLYVFGWPGVRRFIFGFLFFLIALPIPSVIYSPIVGGLQTKVASVTVETLNLIGIPAQRVGSLIHLPAGTVGIDEACSGIRSLQSTVMATLFIGYLTLKQFGFQAALLVSGVCLAIFGNLVRAFYLSYTANAHGIEAIQKTHDAAGWSILLFTAIGVSLLAWLFNKAEKFANHYQASR